MPLVLCRPTRLAQFVLHIVFSVNMYSVCTTVCEELNDDDDDDGDDGDGDELSKSLMIPLRLWRVQICIHMEGIGSKTQWEWGICMY